jgi:hypothetical protein
VFSNNVFDAVTQSIKITATLVNPFQNPAVPARNSDFKAIVTNPCTMTLIENFPSSMMNFVTFAGYSITSKDKYTLSDQISILRAQSSFEGDFCGEKTFVFTVNETDTTYLSFNNPDYIHFSPPMNAKEFGIG